MTFWQVVLLGFVQGFAEFLPISSSGHLVLLESLWGHASENLALNISLHFGSLLSILVVYRKEILPVLRQPRLVLAIIIATLPLVVSGLLLKPIFEEASTSALAAGIGLCITGGLLIITPWFDRGERTLSEIRLRDALAIGLFQAVTPWPGISRSGTTIVAALLMGIRREAAANFSFFIAVPALLGATVLIFKDLLTERPDFSTPWTSILAGTLVSFVVGIVALKTLLRIVTAGKLNWFAAYVLILAAVTITATLSSP